MSTSETSSSIEIAYRQKLAEILNVFREIISSLQVTPIDKKSLVAEGLVRKHGLVELEMQLLFFLYATCLDDSLIHLSADIIKAMENVGVEKDQVVSDLKASVNTKLNETESRFGEIHEFDTCDSIFFWKIDSDRKRMNQIRVFSKREY
jgi:hypothetical protein